MEILHDYYKKFNNKIINLKNYIDESIDKLNDLDNFYVFEKFLFTQNNILDFGDELINYLEYIYIESSKNNNDMYKFAEEMNFNEIKILCSEIESYNENLNLNFIELFSVYNKIYINLATYYNLFSYKNQKNLDIMKNHYIYFKNIIETTSKHKFYNLNLKSINEFMFHKILKILISKSNLEITKYIVLKFNINIHKNKEELFRVCYSNCSEKFIKWFYYFDINKPIDLSICGNEAFRTCCANGYLEMAKIIYKDGVIDIYSANSQAFAYSKYYGKIDVYNWLKSIQSESINNNFSKKIKIKKNKTINNKKKKENKLLKYFKGLF